MDNLSIVLQAKLNVARSQTDINNQVKQLSENLKGLNLKLDTGTAKSDIKILADGTQQLQKYVASTTDSYGRQVQIIQQLNKETNEMVVSQLKLVNSNKQYLADLKSAQVLKNTYNKQLFENFNQDLGIGNVAKSASESASVFEKLYSGQEKIQNLKSKQFWDNYSASLDTTSKSAKSSASVFSDLFDKSNKTYVGLNNIEKTTAQLNPVMKELSTVTDKSAQSFGSILTKIALWGASTSLIYGSLRQLSEGVSYIAELDNSLNSIRIVTGKTQEDVEKLANSYNKLAKEMSVTTSELASTSADLYRQGLDDSSVEDRMKAIVKYSKISGIELQDANDIITASVNSTKADVNELIDVFSYLGRQNCPLVA